MTTAGQSPPRPVRNRSARTALVLLWIAAACGGAQAPLGQEQQELTGTRVRLMEGNLTSGNLQAYEDAGSHIFGGLHPDIALLQEFNVKSNSQADLDAFVTKTFGAGYSYFRESGAGLQIPNGVVSRFPIAASGSITDPKVSNRGFAWAKVKMPDGKFLWAYSLHLLTGGDRNAEATALVAAIKAAVPPGDYVLIGGDFNTGTRTEPCVLTMGQVVSVSGPFPADGLGNQNTSGNRSKPHDWVLVSPNLNALETPVAIGGNTFPGGLVVDTRVYTPIADLAPAQAGDSGASNMQHMGVVRDFLLPGAGPVAAVTVTSPNGGETWAAGSAHPILWTSTALSKVKVEWSADGATWTTVAASVPASAGSTNWTVPAIATSTARVRVSDASSNVSDLSDAPFAITVAAPPGDGFEPDDTFAQAHAITLGVPQVHDLSPATDADWVTFTLPEKSNLLIATTGPTGGDTVLLLTDSTGLKQLGTNDNSGPGNYSLIKRLGFAAGTYGVRVTSKYGAKVILGYSLKVSTF